LWIGDEKISSHDTTNNNFINYHSDDTPVIKSVSDRFGTKAGGTSITIEFNNPTGIISANDNGMSSEFKVMIDGVECVMVDTAPANNQISCTTGAKTNDAPPSFTVWWDDYGYALLKGNTFRYVERWSDYNTWA